MGRAFDAPARGFWVEGIATGCKREEFLPPRPSPLLRVAKNVNFSFVLNFSLTYIFHQQQY